jgi:protein tyrosine phosphatase (PTP) superfamily phosphohydrolase (DUF442 family)
MLSRIPCWQRLSELITTSGSLSVADLSALSALGVRHVINLSLTDSPGALPDEAALMAAAGLRYTHVPVPFSAPSAAHYAAFTAALESSTVTREPEPVHVHCSKNWRVSAFFYVRHRHLGMGEAAARALLEQQWCPEASPHVHAPAWAAFIAAQTTLHDSVAGR